MPKPQRPTANPEPPAETPLERTHADLVGENRALRARLEEAEDALRAIREGDRREDGFRSALAHELHNPFAPIRSADDDRDAAESLGSLPVRQGGRVAIAFDGPSAAEQDGRCPPSPRLRASLKSSRSGLSDAATEVFAGEGAAPGSYRDRVAQASVPGAADAARTAQFDRLRPAASALLHDLAQPLNTIACYAVAARNLATKSAGELTPLANALRGIDEQVLRAGAVLDRLRALLHDPQAAVSDQSRRESPQPKDSR